MTEGTRTRLSLVGSGKYTKEGLLGTGCGILYGLTSPLVGHPIDTVKTKMQAQDAYMKGGALRTMQNVVRQEGFLALWRGLSAPLAGSMVFRSVQFGVYNASYAAMRDSKPMSSEIPFTHGLQYRVLAGGLASATVRAVFETPLEYVKVRRQTGQQWKVGGTWASALRQPTVQIQHLYRGFSVTWMRTWGLMGSFFIMADSLERHHPELIGMPLVGPFLKGGVCATLAWWLVWPFENLKNQVQAGTPGVAANAGWVERARHVLRTRGGVVGLYRGIGPGSARSLIANGTSMIVFTYCQQFARKATGH